MQIDPSPELEALAQAANDAWARGDTAWLAGHTSAEDPLVLGSAPDEEIRGVEAVGQMTESAAEALASLPFTPTDRRMIDARQCGDIGWTIGETSWTFPDGTYVPTRGVTIWHREGGDWKMVVGVIAAAVADDLLHEGSPIAQRTEATV